MRRNPYSKGVSVRNTARRLKKVGIHPDIERRLGISMTERIMTIDLDRRPALRDELAHL